MNGRSSAWCAAQLWGASIAAGLAMILGSTLPPAAPVQAMSCFAIAGTLTCIDTIALPGPPIMPPVVMPQGGIVDGEDEDITIRDDGGRHVARG